MKSFVLALGDAAVVFLTTVLAFALSPSFPDKVFSHGALHPAVVPVAFGMAATVALASYIFGAGDRYLRFGRVETAAHCGISVVVGASAFALLYSFFTNALFGRYILGITILLAWVGVYLVRLLADWAVWAQPRRVMFVGQPTECDAFGTLLTGCARDIQLAGNCDVAVGVYDEERKTSISDIVVGTSATLADPDVDQLMACTASGMRVIQVDAFCEKMLRRVYAPSVDERWFWRYDSQYLHPVYTLAKRMSDVVVSLIGIALSAPLYLVVGILLKLQDRGPILYTQVRVGLNNRPFRIYKFRTMRVDAEAAGPMWAKKSDSRATRLGVLLRRTRIDEVPQFFNILKGDMSFIGPRPERPEMIATIEKEVPFFSYRHLVKPGLTGWAQVNYPYGASIEDARNKLSYDLYYIKYSSLMLDAVIGLRTIVSMVKGAR